MLHTRRALHASTIITVDLLDKIFIYEHLIGSNIVVIDSLALNGVQNVLTPIAAVAVCVCMHAHTSLFRRICVVVWFCI